LRHACDISAAFRFPKFPLEVVDVEGSHRDCEILVFVPPAFGSHLRLDQLA
jgi:hypothetical protein